MENNVNFNQSDEEILDWREEAQAIINDVKSHVNEISVSEKLVSSPFEIYLNVQTLEARKYCVKVSGSGFQVASNDYDKNDTLTDNPEDVFETPYALLTTISEGYSESFAKKLSEKMSSLV